MKMHLSAQRDALAHAFGLDALRVTDGFGKLQDFLHPRSGEKEDTIVIGLGCGMTVSAMATAVLNAVPKS
jgi:hypothetical protein